LEGKHTFRWFWRITKTFKGGKQKVREWKQTEETKQKQNECEKKKKNNQTTKTKQKKCYKLKDENV